MVNVEIAIETTKLTFFTIDCIWANLYGRIIADDFDLVHKENPIKAQYEDLHDYGKFDECEIQGDSNSEFICKLHIHVCKKSIESFPPQWFPNITLLYTNNINMNLLCIFKGNLHLARCNDIADAIQPILNLKDKYNNHSKEITVIFQTTRNQDFIFMLPMNYYSKGAFRLHFIHYNALCLNLWYSMGYPPNYFSQVMVL